MLPEKLIQHFDEENNVFGISSISSGSHKKVWWICELNHRWEQSPKDYSSAQYACPYCANKKILKGFNDISTLHPKIAEEWHPTKNVENLIFSVFPSSHKKAWWLGKCGHEWEARIDSRINGNSCPYCSNKKVERENSFLHTHPDLAQEWHPTKNEPLTPSSITYGSEKKIWWVCEKGHEWESIPYDRLRYNGPGCPYCLNQKIIPGYNDLETTAPELAKEWHPVKNIKKANSLAASSGAIVWWQCEKGHEWESSPSSRINRGKDKHTYKYHRCLKCVQEQQISLAEKDLNIFIKKSLRDTKLETNTRKIIPPFELDIYLPEKKFAVEFNGLYWHSEEQGKGKWYHHNKWALCQDKGIQLIQIWEDDWNRNPELVKRMIAHKLGVSGVKPMYARNTEIVYLPDVDTRYYLEEHHIQGYSQGGIRVGLIDKATGDLVSLMVLKREPGTDGKTLNLLRFVTSRPVQGGFTKLLKFVEKTYQPSSVITFSDNTVSDGGLYEKTGFIAVKKIDPDYMYISNNRRVHKFNYRLKRFRNDPELLWDETLSEKELAKLNNLSRIWDAGKIKWEKKF